VIHIDFANVNVFDAAPTASIGHISKVRFDYLITCFFDLVGNPALL
jgi:hypothetical protein